MRWIALLSCLAGLVLGATLWFQRASPDESPSVETAPLRGSWPSFVAADLVLEELPTVHPLDPSSLLPAQGERVLRYRTEEGVAESHSIRASGGRGLEGARWQYDDGGKHFYDLAAEADGSVVILSEINREHGVLTRYEPPRPVYPAGLEPGEARRTELKVRVFSADDPERQLYDGQLSLVITHRGRLRVKVPAGEFEVTLIEWSQSGTVGPASIELTQWAGLQPGVGAIFMGHQKKITALGLYKDESEESRLLIAVP